MSKSAETQHIIIYIFFDGAYNPLLFSKRKTIYKRFGTKLVLIIIYKVVDGYDNMLSYVRILVH